MAAEITNRPQELLLQDVYKRQVTPKTFKVKANAAQTFTITPDPGYEIEDVLVDGKSIGAVSYTHLYP